MSKKMWIAKREEMVMKRRAQWTPERKIKLSETLKQGYIDHPERRQVVSSVWRASALPAVSAALACDVSRLKGDECQ
jgi:hypothetical protein